jgi:hypothetical protein
MTACQDKRLVAEVLSGELRESLEMARNELGSEKKTLCMLQLQ